MKSLKALTKKATVDTPTVSQLIAPNMSSMKMLAKLKMKRLPPDEHERLVKRLGYKIYKPENPVDKKKRLKEGRKLEVKNEKHTIDLKNIKKYINLDESHVEVDLSHESDYASYLDDSIEPESEIIKKQKVITLKNIKINNCKPPF